MWEANIQARLATIALLSDPETENKRAKTSCASEWLHAFSHACCLSRVFVSSSDWFILLTSVVIGRSTVHLYNTDTIDEYECMKHTFELRVKD